MLDIGWSELLVIGVVALIVVGPKDLPRMFRTLGEFTGRARRMAREFQQAMNDAADESGVGDIAGDLRKMANPKKYGTDLLKDATRDLSAWNPDEAAKTGATRSPLSPERDAARRKIEAATARKAEDRMAAEAARQPDLDAAELDAAELAGEPDETLPATAGPDRAGLRPDPAAPEIDRESESETKTA